MLFDGQVVQNAYIVNDIEKAIDDWITGVGAGPFFLDRMVLPVKYRGQDSSIDMTFAIGQAGPVMIELIKVNSSTPNVYTDAYPAGSSGGFHHIAMIHKDIDAAVKAHNAKGHVSAGEHVLFGTTKVVYVDARQDLGCMVEFFADTPEVRGVFQFVADAAKGWDGRDRIRTFPTA